MPFVSEAQRRFMYANHPRVARRWQREVQQQAPVGGYQPYHGGSPSAPGPALTAMLKGATASGWNPMQVQRDAQRTARRGTLADRLR